MEKIKIDFIASDFSDEHPYEECEKCPLATAMNRALNVTDSFCGINTAWNGSGKTYSNGFMEKDYDEYKAKFAADSNAELFWMIEEQTEN